MTVEEVKAKRIEYENKMLELVNEFENTVGIEVTGLSFITVTAMTSTSQEKKVGVSFDLRIH